MPRAARWFSCSPAASSLPAAITAMIARMRKVLLVPAIARSRDLAAGLAIADSQHISEIPLCRIQSLGACAAPSREFPELCVLFTCRRGARDDLAIALCVCAVLVSRVSCPYRHDLLTVISVVSTCN